MDDFARIPFHALWNLHDGNAGAQNLVAVFRQAVRNRDAVAEKRVGDLFALHHAVHVAGLDVVRLDEQVRGFPDRVGFRRGSRTDFDVAKIKCHHKMLLHYLCTGGQPCPAKSPVGVLTNKAVRRYVNNCDAPSKVVGVALLTNTLDVVTTL